MAPAERTSDCSLLLIYQPRKDDRLSWPSWPTCSGRLTPYNWSLVRCRTSAGRGKLACQRSTFYHCATPPTIAQLFLLIILSCKQFNHKQARMNVSTEQTFFLATIRTLPCSMKYIQSAWSPCANQITRITIQSLQIRPVQHAHGPDLGTYICL